MHLSCVILTHNRRDALLTGLGRLHGAIGLGAGQWEAIVVDNASADGSAEASG